LAQRRAAACPSWTEFLYVLFLIESDRLRYRIEMLLADLGPFRGYILRNRWNNLHRMIFAQWPLVTPLQLLDGWDDDIARQAQGNLRAHIGGDPREFWLPSRHLNFLDGDAC
jgi:hypothetical protein